MSAIEIEVVSPAADCECMHPYRLHTLAGERCEVSACMCVQFKQADSKLSHSTRCYCCGSIEHAAKFCPYVKGQKARGYP